MTLATLIILGFSLSADAFAAALGQGARRNPGNLTQVLQVGLFFGVFEAISPAFGWAVGTAFAGYITEYDHWVAFALLAVVGGHMVVESCRAAEPVPALAGDAPAAADTGVTGQPPSRLRLMLTAAATSIDAAAVGVSLAMAEVNIVVACLVIGLVTTAVTCSGVLIGRTAGPWLGRKAEILGGLALIAIGAKILADHLTAG